MGSAVGGATAGGGAEILRAARLSPLVRCLRAPNPSPMTLDGTNTYLVGARPPVTVIDPGPADPGHLARIAETAGEVGLVLLTHGHADHAEGAERLARATGAPLAAPGGTREDAMAVVDGEEVGAGDTLLRAVATPGHSSEHVCFFLEDEGVLFTGDHILGEGTTVVAHPDGDMSAYLRSLERVRELEPRRIYPGHGPIIDDPAEVIDYYISHRLEREQQIVGALAEGPATVEDLVARIYADVDPVLHPVAALTVQAHLAKLEREGLVGGAGGRWRTGSR